jgi:hypothetical protein
MPSEIKKITHHHTEPISAQHPIYDALAEIQKPRTRFQLEHFVVGQHDTDAQQYKQVLLELQSALYTYRVAVLQVQRVEIEIKRLKDSGDDLDAIDAKIKTIELEKNNIAMLGAYREISDLVEIWDMFEHKYTYEEIEADQPHYWDLRLTRQAQLESIGKGGQVDWGSLEALRQIGKFTNQDVEENLNKIKEIE